MTFPPKLVELKVHFQKLTVFFWCSDFAEGDWEKTGLVHCEKNRKFNLFLILSYDSLSAYKRI